MFLMLVVVSVVAVHLMLITLAYVDFEYFFCSWMFMFLLKFDVWLLAATASAAVCSFSLLLFFSVVVVYVSLLLYALLKYKQKKLLYTAKFTLGIYTGAKQQYAAKQFPSSNFTVTCHISHVNMLALRWQTGTEGTKNCECM